MVGRTAKLERLPRANGAGIVVRPVLNTVEGVETMPTKKKIDMVDELREKFDRCTIAIATDFTGLSVNTMTELRQKMREKDIEYRVVKNTLTYLAAEAADRPQVKEIVQGPTGLAFGYGEPVEVAKALEEYIRVNRSSLAIRGALLDKRALTAAEAISLSRLPPKPELVSELLGQLQLPLAALMAHLQSPMARLLTVLNGPAASLAVVLQQRVAQLSSQERQSPEQKEEA
jgi:large subunit ribosomal protein L10